MKNLKMVIFINIDNKVSDDIIVDMISWTIWEKIIKNVEIPILDIIFPVTQTVKTKVNII